MRKAKFSVIYNRKNQLNSNGLALVQIRVHFSKSEQSYLSTGIYLAPEFWTGTEVHPDHPSSILYNKQIDDLLSDLKSFEFSLNIKGRELTKKSLNVFRKSGASEISFIQFYEDRLKKQRTIEPSTYTDQNQTLEKLQEFNPELRFSEIDQSFVDDFTDHLLDIPLSKNTITKHYKNIKKYLNLAIDYKEYSFDQYRVLKWRVKYKSNRKVYLNYQEIENLMNLDLDNERLQLSNLAFLLLCFTGIRASDLLKLRKDDLHQTKEGTNVDIYTMQKTKDPVFLPLYDLFGGAGEIVLKKLLSMSDDEWPLVLPKKMYEQKINTDLKVLTAAAKINKHITMHVARHTFCTLLAYESKDQFLVMKYAGISKPETALGYIHLSKELGDQALKRINWSKKFE